MSDAETADEASEGVATRVTISYPADLSDWGRDQLDGRIFRAYLRRKLDRVQPGDGWEEFLDVGCCGRSLDVPLQVESVSGGDRVGEETAIEYVEREACGIRGGWEVQSAAGPATE
jgi:hypothetical protein